MVVEKEDVMQEDQLAQRIREITLRMSDHENKQQYLEAEKDRTILDETKTELKTLKRSQLKSKHANDYNEFHKMSKERTDGLQAKWDKTFQDSNERMQSMHSAMQRRHEGELLELRDKLEKKTSNPRFSTSLLGLRKKQYLLGKQQRYVEAEVIQRNADRLEQEEISKHEERCSRQSQKSLDKLMECHEEDLKNLRERFETERNQLAIKREEDQQILAIRTRKQALDLDKKHGQENIRLENELKNLSTMVMKDVAGGSGKPKAVTV